LPETIVLEELMVRPIRIARNNDVTKTWHSLWQSLLMN